MRKMYPMSSFDIRLVFTLYRPAQRQYTAVQKMCTLLK